MERFFITGCNGQLGRALNQLLKDREDIVVYNTEYDKVEHTLDITDGEEVLRQVKGFQPTVIFNCAAYTAVDACEEEEDEAFLVNAQGPANLAQAARETGAKLVHISTDYVYRGDADRPYVETDETAPQSAYGRTKLAGEKKIQEICPQAYIIRTAWLYGEGKNFVQTMLRLAEERDVLTVVNDQYGTPTSALELARAILYILEKGEYGIYHATCEGSTTWYAFAKKIFEKKGISITVKPVTSEEYKAAAKRPAYSVLENQKLNHLGTYRMKDWESALEEYLNSL